MDEQLQYDRTENVEDVVQVDQRVNVRVGTSAPYHGSSMGLEDPHDELPRRPIETAEL